MVVIAISGQPGAGSTTVGKLLSKKLGLDYFSPGRLFKDIAQGRVKNQFYYSLFKNLCDSRGLVIPDMSLGDDSNAANDFWNTPLGKSEELHKIIDELQMKLSEKGGMVIDGKISVRMIDDADVRVWLEAAIDVRAQRASKRDGIPFEEAKRVVIERQEKERKEWEKIYGFDYFKQRDEADLLINTEGLTPEEIVNKVVTFLKMVGSYINPSGN